jgi:hypothetical protein
MKRTIALGAAWTASAAAAVGLGFLAVSFVDASASPGTQPVAASTTPSTPSAAPTGSDSPETPVTTGRPPATAEHVTAGGTVYADCTSGSPVVAAVPAAGWRVDPSDDPGKVEFDRAAQEVEIRVHCVDGSPSFVLDDHSSAPSSSSSSSPSSSSPATSTSGRDDSEDSSGHGSGGSGSDDSDDSEDSSGHGSGGSGSGSDDSEDSSGHGSGGSGSDD